ncbi:MAG: RNA methyltransferase [Bacteroidales bacterium]|jgi:TrmH family RNA methyltransferase
MKWQSITSPTNARIRQLLRLQEKPRERKEAGVVIVEGLREIMLAIGARYTPLELYIAEEFVNQKNISAILEYLEGTSAYMLSQEAFTRIAYRENRDGVVAIFESRNHQLNHIKLSSQPLLLIAESVEKPGNLGALLRTADAAGVDALIVCDPKTDIYNPNVVRASIGTLFSVQVGVATTSEVLVWLQENGIRPFAAALSPKAIPYTQADFRSPVAIVVGTEADGLSHTWLNACPDHIIIPMHGTADSLNVSVSAAIIIYEALRQRSLQP